MSPLALALVGGLTTGLIVPMAPQPWVLSTRSAPIFLCADAEGVEARIKEAATRVVTAASKFGHVQGTAAAMWVEEAMDACIGETCNVDVDDLMEKQLTLFEDCLVEDAIKCIELDLALTSLEKQLKEDSGPLDSLTGLFGKSKVERALARVRTAAAKFGKEQEQIAEIWLAEVRVNGSMNPFALLEQQVALFDECLLDDDDDKCKELREALSALQGSLGVHGKVISTAGLTSK